MYNAQPGATLSSLPSAPVSYSRQTSQSAYTASTLYQPRSSNEGYYGSALSSPGTPKVVNWQPLQGPPGTTVFLTVVTPDNLSSPWSFTAIFETFRRQCQVMDIESGIGFQYWHLKVETPHLQGPTSLSQDYRVPFRIHVQDDSGHSVGYLDLGVFRYTYGNVHTQSPELSRKRKLSIRSPQISRSSLRSPALSQLPIVHDRVHSNTQRSEMYNSLETTASGIGQQQGLSSGESTPTSFAPRQTSSRDEDSMRHPSPPRRMLRHVSTNSLPSSKRRSPPRPTWSGSATPLHVIPSPGLTAPYPDTFMAGPSASLPDPSLVRTSTVSQNPGSSNFTPYTLLHKAILKIDGDLDSMTENWTAEERGSGRRLVQFTRSQNGSTIYTSFEPVAPAERAPNAICISCIWWRQKQEFFCTSVDTIHLLEQLVNVHFAVEEKNRIRRNLEGYRPLTVSKGKADSEAFFKLIMRFPNPKPRNIEKDVKVFPWKVLSLALRKIFGKYVSTGNNQLVRVTPNTTQSASYSSITGPMSTAGPSFYHNRPSRTNSDLDYSLESTPMVSPVSSHPDIMYQQQRARMEIPGAVQAPMHHYPVPFNYTTATTYPHYAAALPGGASMAGLEGMPAHRPVEYGAYVSIPISENTVQALPEGRQDQYGYPLSHLSSHA